MPKLLKNPYLELCKPRVVALILLTAAVGMLLSRPGGVHVHLGALYLPDTPAWTLTSYSMPWIRAAIALIGIGCTAACGAVINHIIEQKIDQRMSRTHRRPLAMGRIKTPQALLFACVIGALGLGLLWYFVNPLTMILSMGALVGYGFIYTGFLKRATPQNIVIGGLAGAMPPLLGWVAISPHMVLAPVLFVLIIFTWTPPHFWALAIDRIEDYKKSKLPMLPVTHGIAFTKKRMVYYTVAMIIATLLPVLNQTSGLIYLISALLLNARFMQWVIRLDRSADHAPALATFYYSIRYLGLLFMALLIDHFILITI